ncbi:MAG: LTA synthase family protein [Gammaproteobacteria bacterium]|nr:LTA synthase family protein [Gammaproteobacteria bacterium]MBU2479431.1 LTA synthase family protein [Gammaproteobacteria bacterium]
MSSSPLPGGNRLFFLAIPFYLPALLRVFLQGEVNVAGILSDVALGSLFLCLTLLVPRFFRVILLAFWTAFQVSAREMLAAMQRFPNWQDLHYLTDPTFLGNTGAGLHLASPLAAGLMLVALIVALLASTARLSISKVIVGLVIGSGLLVLHGVANRSDIDSAVASRFNALHWFIRDAVSMPFRGELATPLPPPKIYTTADVNGTRLLGNGNGKAKNVLIVTLEGLHGGYHPDIRKALGVTEDIPFMMALAAQTTDAMLVPEFVTHSHQTIRGLYALLCGDVSQLGTDMPKAYQVIGHPRAEQCLPAQMANAGWSTHYLQGAGLTFMNKDRVMPAIGFQQTYGSEWFTEKDDIPFLWGASDPAFFKGARKYIGQLQAKDEPWMLTLMTVGTHQPYGVTDEIVQQYPDRLTAAVAVLDKSAGQFLAEIKADGVLEDTLVIVTSDESHGARQADWISSWGLNIVFAPEQSQLPRLKPGTYGLMDMETSVLDYFDLPIPDQVGGRSFFRDYANGRDIASYTGSVLRWQSADKKRYECTIMEGCQVCVGAGILGNRPASCAWDNQGLERTLFRIAYALDHSLDASGVERVMRFANGDIRELPERQPHEWIDNMIGAQYLDFPKGSKVQVSIKLKAPADNASDVQMKLTLRAWENEVGGIDYAPFPVLKAGESTSLDFDFVNERHMKSFSFHLFGQGVKSRIQIDEFTVKVTPQAS